MFFQRVLNQYFIYFLLILLLSCSCVATEDDFNELASLSLEDLFNIEVETATKTTEKNSLSPAIMTIITAQDIKNYGYHNVAEALSQIASFIDNYDLAIHNFGVRGINSGVRSGSRTIKFMLDGQSVAFNSTSQNFIDNELISMDLIERIEVVRGPVSSLYGANAFLGVVNIVSKMGSKLAQDGGELGIQWHNLKEAGTGYSTSITFGDNSDLWDYIVGLNKSEVHRGGISLPASSFAYQDQELKQSITDDAEPFSFYGRLKYQTPDHEVKLSGHYQELVVDQPFFDINALKPQGTTKIALDNMFLRLDYGFIVNDKMNLHTYLTYNEGGTLDDDKIEVGADKFYLSRNLGYTGIEFGSEIFLTFRKQDSLLLGIDAKVDHHDIETFTRVDRDKGLRTEVNPNKEKTIRDSGFYVQYITQLNEDWRAIVGYRLDDDSVIGKQSSARLGLVGQLPYDVIIKLLGGSSFQTPSPELLYRTAIQAGDIIGNPDLLAQQAKTYELSATIPVNNLIGINLTYFNTRVEDLVIFKTDGSNLLADNSADSKTHGIEAELRLIWQGLSGFMNYSWQKTKRDKNPDNLFLLEHRENGEIVPEQAANLGLSYYWQAPEVNISWRNRWVGRREASSLNVLQANQFYSLDSYIDSSFSLSTNRYSFIKNREANLTLQVKDVFNTKYVNPGFGGIEFPSLGRQLLISFAQRF